MSIAEKKIKIEIWPWNGGETIIDHLTVRIEEPDDEEDFYGQIEEQCNIFVDRYYGVISNYHFTVLDDD